MAGQALHRTLYPVEARTWVPVPLALWRVACGFPSPAEDYMDKPLDFNELLIQRPASTFAVIIDGDSMSGIGLFPGDYAVIDRSLAPRDKSIVLAVVNGEFTIKRYRLIGGRVVLKAENRAYRDLVISEGTSFEVWGVVKNVIRMLGP